MTSQPKRALVLSGGGVRGAYQVGVLKKWLFDDNKDYDVLCGVSVGALNTLSLAKFLPGDSAPAFKLLESIWYDISDDRLLCNWYPFGKLTALWKKSIYDSSPLKNLIKGVFDSEAIRNSGKIIRIGAICLNTGEEYFANENDDNLDEWAIASASYPVFMEPVIIDNKLWIDGGIKIIAPISQAIRAGATEIDVILCSSQENSKPWLCKQRLLPLSDIMMRCIDLMSERIIRADVRITGINNDLVILDSKYKEIKIRIIKPSVYLTDNNLKFNNEDIKRMMQIGYEDACK